MDLAIRSRPGPTAPSRALEGAAWLGLACGLAVFISATLAPPALAMAAHPFGPSDLVDWSRAIEQAIGAAIAAANLFAIAWHRWGRRPRKPPRRKGAPPEAKS